MIRRILPAGLLVALAAGGAQAAALDFGPCDDPSAGQWPGADCARVMVPLDHAAPEAGDIALFVRRLPAAGEARGRVWLIAGGPSESGAAFRGHLDTVRRAWPDFDVLVPDHRGTGYSTRLCPREEAVESAGGTALEGAEWGTCYGALIADPARTQAFSIDNAARDLAALLEAAADARPTHVYAVSYGTQLILRSLHGETPPLAGLVLDSLVPPETAAAWDLSMRSQVVDDVGRQVLAARARDAACRARFDDAPEAVLRRLHARFDAEPALAEALPGGSLRRLLGSLLDVPAARARIPALVAALDADPAATGPVDAAVALLLGALGGSDDPQAPISIPLVSLISVSENTLRPHLTAAEVEAEEAALLFSSPLPALLLDSPLPRTPPSPHSGAVPPRLPPTLVLAGTLDPKTHHDGVVAHAALLAGQGEVSRVDVVDAPHFVLMFAPDCPVDAVTRFNAGTAPPARCVPDDIALRF